MKFHLTRASDWADLGEAEVNTIEDLKKVIDEHKNTDDDFYGWEAKKAVVDFEPMTQDDKLGTITVYDYYIE